jgi:hypothetical protein
MVGDSFFYDGDTILPIQRTFNCKGSTLKNVGVDHGGLYIFVAEKFLDGADVVPFL